MEIQPQHILRALYRVLCFIGIQTLQWGHMLAHAVACPLRAIARFAARQAHRIGGECRRLKAGFVFAGERVRAAREQSVWLAALTVLALPFGALRRHKKALALIGNVVAPVAAALVLTFVVQYWSQLSFGLSVEYEGESFGYITDEKVFDNAAAQVNASVQTAQGDSVQMRTPKLTLTVLPEDAVLDEETVRDKLITSSADEVVEATGLYVDGELIGALTSAQELDDVLDERLNAGRYGEDASFVQSVQSEDGLYAVSLVLSAEELREKLNGTIDTPVAYTVKEGDTAASIAAAFGITPETLRADNGIEAENEPAAGQTLTVHVQTHFLQVRSRELQTREERVPYTTRTEDDPGNFVGNRTVKTEGVDGVRVVTEAIVYIDGVRQSVEEVSSEVTAEPVEEVVLIGTRAAFGTNVYTPGVTIANGDGVVTGTMRWPVPAVHSLSQGYHSGHGGIDIANGPVPMLGTPIVAADGGVVSVANTNPNDGYGLYVIIDHGNGLQTLYAHMSSLSVTAGQSVSKGQEVGRGGSTGWSTGPHLHFEVRVNGTRVNPLDYVS